MFAAKTILRVVTNHLIEFDYQEMTIIKSFNRALENIGTDPNSIEEFHDTDDQWNEVEEVEEEQTSSEIKSEKTSD